jgi:hypothetical protein
MTKTDTPKNWVRLGNTLMKCLTVIVVFAVGLIIGGLTMGIALGAGASVAVFSDTKATRRWRRTQSDRRHN